jgi:hypothetical protein
MFQILNSLCSKINTEKFSTFYVPKLMQRKNSQRSMFQILNSLCSKINATEKFSTFYVPKLMQQKKLSTFYVPNSQLSMFQN